MEGLKNLLDQMHESALGLLKIAYTDNQLIRSTLLSDLLPQLHEAYVSSPCAPPSSAQEKYARSSQGQFHIEGPPIPNVLIAVMTLMQAAVLIAPDAAGSTHELGTHGRTAISKSKGIIGIDNGQNAEEMAFKYGSKQISAFLAGLMKVCCSWKYYYLQL